MVKMKTSLFALLVLFTLSACHTSKQGWKMVWEENFDGAEINNAVWSKIPRSSNPPEWRKYMSSHPDCYEVKDGNLILRGIKNTNLAADTATYLTGGVYTKHKKAFHGGRLEVRAKLQGAKGAWPAIWMKPYDEERFRWPTGGEIDIMERLNHDAYAYQTVHSTYTHTLGIKHHPQHGYRAPINPDDYNVYGVEMYPDSVVFFINGVKDFTYPRITTDKEGQFPFDKPYYLLIDMQLGGSWVGKIDPAQVPVEMKVDWVRYYRKK